MIGGALLLFADHVICMTEYLKRNFKILSYKIKQIPLGINDDFFPENFTPPPTNALRLIFPGQFRHGKNQDLIIRAFSKYVKRTGDCISNLNLPGTGELVDEYKRLAQELGVLGQVCFPGQLTKQQIKKEYLKSNVAIIASNSETFGQSIVEPYVLGRCVVSKPVGVSPEIIKNYNNGFLFESEEELVEILLKLRNKNLIEKIAIKNFSLREKFKWENISKEYICNLLYNKT